MIRNIMIIGLLIGMIFLFTGCKSQDNILAESSIVAEMPKQVTAPDTSQNSGLDTIERAKQERAVEKSIQICSTLEGLRKDWCFIDVAEMTDVPEEAKTLCSRVSGVMLKYSCYKDAAVRFEDIAICDAIQDQALSKGCIAYATEDCSLIDNIDEQEFCESII